MEQFFQKNFIGGVAMQGALLLDAGPFGHSGESISLCAKAGLSAICTETISLADGKSPWWNIYRQGNTLYNCSKWSDLPYRQWADVEIPKAKKSGATVIATVGMHAEDARRIIPALNDSGADGIKVVSYYEEDMPELVSIAKHSTNLPVWAKLSSNWKDPVAIGKLCRECGADALVAMDTIGPVRYFHEGRYPALNPSAQQYWMSGESIHARALDLVTRLAAKTLAPVIGVGGVMDADGVRRMMACGASAVGLCSAVIIHGLNRVSEIYTALKNAAPLRPNFEDWNGDAHITIDASLCNGCGECVKRCGYLALRPSEGGVLAEDHACRRCGLCVQHCPAGAISLCRS